MTANPITAAEADATGERIAHELSAALDTIRAAYRRDPAPPAEQRIDRLQRLGRAVIDHKDDFIEAIDDDFGGRPRAETLVSELLPLLEGIRYNSKHLRKWMKDSSRRTPLWLAGTRANVHYQPLGVVGIVVPWNFPVFLGLSPLVSVFAAGNRAMIKTSEFAPVTGELLEQVLSDYFSDEELAIVNGGVDVATEFTKLPFDHLVFTGSTQVGRIVMRAAADNLTPVTLELGGKSPAIIHDSFPVDEAAKRIAFAKGLNAGQVCVAPDYVLVPRGKVDAFVNGFAKQVSRHYPSMDDNPDYTSIITAEQRNRLLDNVRDAEEKGAQVITINPADESFDDTRKLPMRVLTNVSDDMRVMREEIFGPLLPVLPYDTLDEALDYVNGRDRPLALYYFDWDDERAETVVARTHSGGVGINELMTQTVVDDMPFGGIGPSGTGHYHGKEGFLNFSKAKGVIRKGRLDATSLIGAPWGNRLFNLFVNLQLRRLSRGLSADDD